MTCTYAGAPAQFQVYIRFKDENDSLQLIRGNPYNSSFIVSDKENDFKGEQVKNYISERLEEIQEFSQQIKDGIDTKKSEYQENRFDLLKIKEHINLLHSQRSAYMLDLETIYQILQYFEQMEKPMVKEKEATKSLIKGLNSLKKQSVEVAAKIRGEIKDQSQQCLKEIERFELELKSYFLDLKKKDIYKYVSGVEKSFGVIGEIQEDISTFEQVLRDFDYFTKMFEFPDKTEQAHQNMKTIKHETSLVLRLWQHIKKCQTAFADNLLLRWKDIDAV